MRERLVSANASAITWPIPMLRYINFLVSVYITQLLACKALLPKTANQHRNKNNSCSPGPAPPLSGVAVKGGGTEQANQRWKVQRWSIKQPPPPPLTHYINKPCNNNKHIIISILITMKMMMMVSRKAPHSDWLASAQMLLLRWRGPRI